MTITPSGSDVIQRSIAHGWYTEDNSNLLLAMYIRVLLLNLSVILILS